MHQARSNRKGWGNGRGQGHGHGHNHDHGSDLQYRQAHLSSLQAMITATPVMPLSPAERDDLYAMREEEKVAHDVYVRLYGQWQIPPFRNISGSEQVHMAAVLALLEHYGLPDPVQGLGDSQFRDTGMQALYDRLIGQGLQSLEEAVRVGLLIEELDIVDLRAAARRTDKPAILAVYADLEMGSRNHLRAFYQWMQQLGIHYVPEHLAPEEFQAIARSPHEEC